MPDGIAEKVNVLPHQRERLFPRRSFGLRRDDTNVLLPKWVGLGKDYQHEFCF